MLKMKPSQHTVPIYYLKVEIGKIILKEMSNTSTFRKLNKNKQKQKQILNQKLKFQCETKKKLLTTSCLMEDDTFCTPLV